MIDKKIIVFGVVLIVITLVVMGLYFLNFNGPVGDNEIWAQFGNYLAGTLGTLFGGITLLYLIYTSHLQKKESDKQINLLESQNSGLYLERLLSNFKNIEDNFYTLNKEEKRNQEIGLDALKIVTNNLCHSNKESIKNYKNGVYITVSEKGRKAPINSIRRYVNIVEAVIKWDYLNRRNKTIKEEEHITFLSEYHSLIKTYIDEECFTTLVLLRDALLQLEKNNEIISRENIPYLTRFLDKHEKELRKVDGYLVLFRSTPIGRF